MSGSNASLIVPRLAAFLLTMLLSGCGLFSEPELPPPPKPRHIRHVEPAPAPTIDEAIVYPPDAYLLHLSLAELALIANPSGTGSAAADLDIAGAYSRQKQQDAVTEPVIIIDYALKGQEKHRHIAIPFALPAEDMNLSPVEEAMTRLNALPYTLYDLKVAEVSLPPPAPLGDEDSNAAAAEAMVEERMEPVIKAAAMLPSIDQARINLKLARFFIQHEYKEPAYLVIENAKQSLAATESAGGDSGVTQELEREIEAQESLLHKTMPFTLGF